MQPIYMVDKTAPGMAFARRYEADPRDSLTVRPQMDDDERGYLDKALSDEAATAVSFYRQPDSD